MGQMKGLRVNLVSLVTKPASGEKFIVTKSAEGEGRMELKEILKNLDVSDEAIAKVDGLNDEDRTALDTVLDPIVEVAEAMPGPVMKSIGQMAQTILDGVQVQKSEDDDDGGTDGGDGGDGDDGGNESDTTEALKSLTGTLESVNKGLTGLGDTVKSLGGKFDNLNERITALEAGKRKGMDADGDEQDTGDGVQKGSRWPSFQP